MAKKKKGTKKRRTAAQRRATAKLVAMNRGARRGGKKKSGGKRRRRASRTASSGEIRTTSRRGRGRRRRSSSGSKSLGKVLRPSWLALEVGVGTVAGDVIEDVVTKGGKIRFTSPEALLLIMLGVAHSSRTLANVGYGLELRALAREHFGHDKTTGIARRSVEEWMTEKLHELLPGKKSNDESSEDESSDESESTGSITPPESTESDEGVNETSAASSTTY